MSDRLPRGILPLCAGILLGATGATLLSGYRDATPPPVASPAGDVAATRAPTSQPDPPSNRPSGTVVTSPHTEDTRSGEQQCQEALADLRLRADFLEQQLELLGGARSEWPTDVDVAYTEPAVDEWLAEAVEEHEVGTVETLDCNEYPCIGVFRFPPDAAASSAVLQPLTRDFAAHTGGARGRIHVVGTPKGAWGTVVFSPDLEEDYVQQQRIEKRIEELTEQFVGN